MTLQLFSVLWCASFQSPLIFTTAGDFPAHLLNKVLFNSFGAKIQTTFVVCFSFLTNYRLKKSLYVKLTDWMSNKVDPDETARMSRLIWIYAVCKSLLLSLVAVKELRYAYPTLQITFSSFKYENGRFPSVRHHNSKRTMFVTTSFQCSCDVMLCLLW